MVLIIKSDQRRLNREVCQLDKKMKNFIKRTWQDVGVTLKKDLKSNMLEKKSGRIYSINGRLHQASAPEERPANLSGRLRKGVGYRAYSWYKMEFGLRESYAPFLEMGTRRMKARKPLRRTVEANYRTINKRLRNVGLR